MADTESAASASGHETTEGVAPDGESEPPVYDLSIDPAVTSLSDKNLRYLSGTLRDLIAHRIDGINYAEGRRAQLAAIGGAISAIGLALMPFAGGVRWIPLRAVYIELSLASLALGALIWITYAWQTNYNYPFKTELATWKWFYHQALPDKTQFGPGLVRNRGKKRRDSEEEEYGTQWEKFAKQAVGLSDPKVDATQDLKQLYQLHVNERYKNLFLSQLRNLLMRGLLVVLAGAILTFLVALTVYDPADETSRSEWSSGGITMSAKWKETGVVRDDGLSTHDIQFRVQATLANRTTHEVTWSQLAMLDEDRDAIPAEFSVTPRGPAVIEPGEVLEISGYFWVAGSDRDNMRTLLAQ